MDSFKRLIPDISRVSAKDMNRVFSLLEGFLRSGFANGILSSDGTFILRKSPAIPAVVNQMRRAKLTADAGSGSTITANLYSVGGVEQTTGDEAGVTVYCRLHGTENLNEAFPVLSEDEEIAVVKFAFVNPDETVTWRWYCQTEFGYFGPCT